MRIAYIGNFGPEHSTENHVARALEYNGHTVARLQENDPKVWEGLSGTGADWLDSDFFLWTRTGFAWGEMGGTIEHREDEWRFLHRAKRAGIPVVGAHLDIWWGLERQRQVYIEPFFQVDLLCTADGGHDEEWRNAAVRHHWMPPGVSLAECEPGMYRSDFASPLAFVGSHQGHYHRESDHRHELVAWLKLNFARDCAFWPRPGEPAIRGRDLRDLYASIDIAIGDSCFSGTGLPRYWSDRIPETLGRGAYLLHPKVEGMVGQGFRGGVWGHGTMGTWTAYDWDALGREIEWALSHPEERKAVAKAGRELVLARHTYEVRMQQLIDEMVDRGLIK